MIRRAFLTDTIKGFIGGIATLLFFPWKKPATEKPVGSKLNDGKWHHAIVVFESEGKKTLYVDGEISEVIVFDKALSSQEVSSLYNNGLSVSLEEAKGIGSVAMWFNFSEHDIQNR